MQKVLITGSRKGVNSAIIRPTLLSIISKMESATIIHGGASGADTIGSEVAQLLGLTEIIMRPDYRAYPPRVAPLIRNTELVHMADMVICIWGINRVGKGGTMDTFKKARKKGIQIIEILPTGEINHPPEQAQIF